MTAKGNKYCPIASIASHDIWVLCRYDACMFWDNLDDDCGLASLSRRISELGESLERSILRLKGR